MDDGIEAERSLGKVNRVCKFISVLIKLIFAVFCICWLSSICAMVYSLLNSGAEGYSGLHILLYAAHGLAMVLIFAVFVGIFSDAARGCSPFVMKQVQRLRLIACFLVIYSILDIFVSGNVGMIQYAGLDSGYVSTSANEIIPINLAPIIGAVVAFAFSFVFQYGVLLQELSDETL